MKTKWGVFLFVAILSTLLVGAIAQPASAAGELEITDITPNYSPLIATEAVIFTVSYQNTGNVNWPTTEVIRINFTLSKGVFSAECKAAFNLTESLEAKGTRTREFSDCPITPPEAGDYVLKASINDSPASERSLTVVQSSLPENVNRLFTGLGIFVAMMAIMAAGTEVAIDVLRVLVGMKSKVTAMDALKDLENKIPGQLAALGVSQEDIQMFKYKTTSLRMTLEKPTKVAETIRSGKFGQIVLEATLTELVSLTVDKTYELLQTNQSTNLLKHLPEKQGLKEDLTKSLLSKIDPKNLSVSDLLGEQTISEMLNAIFLNLEDKAKVDLKDLTNKIHQALQSSLNQLLDAIHKEIMNYFDQATQYFQISSDLIKILRGRIDWFFNSKFRDINPQDFVEKLFSGLSDIFTQEGPSIAAEWMDKNADELLKRGEEFALAQFDAYLAPFLNDIGMDVNYIDDKVKKTLKDGHSTLKAKADSYIESVKKLLHVVESQRNQIQSPLRKAWRAIRNTTANFWLFLGTVAVLLIIWIAIPFFLSLAKMTDFVLWFKLLVSLLCVIAMILIWAFLDSQLKEGFKTNSTKALKIIKDAKIALPGSDDPTLSIENRQGIKALALLEKPEEINIIQVPRKVGATMSSLNIWLYRISKNIKENKKPLWFSILSPYLFFHRWLSIGDVLSAIETLWNFILRRENNMGKVSESIAQAIKNIGTDSLAAALMERQSQHQDEESTRLRLLRALSVVMGIILASALSVDAAQLLDNAIPDVSKTINLFYIDLSKLIHGTHPFITSGAPPKNLPGMITPGIILTGLAASAGSAFWHDQLDRLQAAKKGAETVARLVKEVKGEKEEK